MILIQPNVFYPYKDPLVDDQEQLHAEPLGEIDTHSILNDTTKFNNSEIQSEIIRMILVKLIYSLNQGVPFSEQELEILFFRVTKLLSYKQLELKRLTYRCIKELKVQKYTHMIMQSLIRDLNHSNVFIRTEALRFISIIKDEQLVESVGRFVKEAILNKNNYISTTALLVGINIIRSFPKIVKTWKYEIQTQLSTKYKVNYHALLLLNEIDKNYKITHIDNMKLLNLNQSQLANLQILKFMSPTINLIVMNFLFQSLKENQRIVFLESFKCLTQQIEIKNLDFKLIITQFKKLIHPDTDLISLYSSINTIHYFITKFEEYSLKLQELKPYVKSITLVDNIGLASKAILTYLSFNQKKKASLKHLFKYSYVRNMQQNFLDGLFELLFLNRQYGQLIFKALKQKIFQYYRPYTRTIAINIICLILLSNCDLDTHEVLKLLFKLPKAQEEDYQQLIVALICQVYFEIEGISLTCASNCFTYLQKEFEIRSDDFDDVSSRRHQEMKQNILQIIKKSKEANERKVIYYIYS